MCESAEKITQVTGAGNSTVLFHCTWESHLPGSALGPYERSHFSERLQREGKEWVDLLLRQYQPPHQLCSRVNAVYATDSAANAAIFMDGEKFQEELRVHMQCNVQEVLPGPYCYEVKAEPFSKAPMALIRSLELAIENAETVERIALEYWSPTNKWSYWEYFAPCMTVVRLVEWPSTADIERAKALYTLDREVARRLFGF